MFRKAAATGTGHGVPSRNAGALWAAAMAQPYIGGQAVIEGVMMRAPACLTVAVRRPDGTIALREGPYRSAWSKKLWKLPGFRGMAMLVESMTMGFSALQFSAEQQMTEEELAQDQGSGKLAVLVSTLLALGLFIALPQGLASLTARGAGWELGLTDTAFHVLIGAFKLLIFIGYLFAISRIPDVRRLFQYHGAEHKTIHAYEKNLPLTVENVQAQTTLHPRCGTTFLVVVIVVSIVLGSLAAPLLMPNLEGWLGQIVLLAIRIALLPLIAAVSYELQKLSARFCTTGWRRAFLWPGFLFQKITTREPDDDQIEVAIAAMETAAWRDRIQEAAPHGEDPIVFASFARFKEVLTGEGSLGASRAV